MEEPVHMSDDETSDSEVIFVSNSPLPPTESTRKTKGPSNIVTEEMRIDEQLKELGMFEEGMNLEQKQELLVVLAASRETAEHEESMRQKAIEWERQLFSDVDGISTPCESGIWASVGSKTSLASTRNSLPVRDGVQTLPVLNKEESYSQIVKVAEKAFKMLDVEESSQTNDSQDQKALNTPTISTNMFYSTSRDSSYSAYGSAPRRSVERGKHHLSRSAYRPSSPQNSKVAITHPIMRDSGSDSISKDDDDSALSPVDSHRTKLLLEKSMSTWVPCTSPVALHMACQRSSLQEKTDSENVPLFCPDNSSPKDYTSVIHNSFKKYNELLHQVQAKSKTHIQWGDPVKVGRHQMDSLDALTHQAKVRHSERIANMSNRSHVEVSFSEKECNDESAVLNVDTCSDQECGTESEANMRTLKSAFRPIKTQQHSVDNADDSISACEQEPHSEVGKKLDFLPRSKSCPSPVECNSATTIRNTSRHSSGNKEEEESGGKENSLGLNQWSPFGTPSSAILAGSESQCLDSSATNTKFSAFNNLLLEKSQGDSVCESVLGAQYQVRKDGQKTYSHKLPEKSERYFGTATPKTVDTCDNNQAISSDKDSPLHMSETVSSTESNQPQLTNDDIFLSQIEEGGIPRKRKCELRITKLLPNEIKTASPRKRWKKQQ